MDPQPTGAVRKGTKRKDPPTSSADNKRIALPSSKPRPQKRARFADARKIEAQPEDAALKDGELDLQSFMNARAFEIEALESSMQKSTASKSRRAFQSVPREMRRRTASHNAKRVPKRLRGKAQREMASDNTPTVTQKRKIRSTRSRLRAETSKKLDLLIKRKKMQMKKEAEEKGEKMDLDKPVPITTRKPRPKIRRNELNDPPAPKSKFKKRQMNKTWLPTHIWHAKRATMTEPMKPKWGFAIPLTPTQKSYRPTHKAIHQSGGVIAWDMSYMSTIGLYGHKTAVEATLREASQLDETEWKSKGELYSKGCQPAFTWLCYKDKTREICPVTVIFNPKPPPPRRKNRRPKVEELREYGKREVLLRIHPSAFKEAWDWLRRLTKMRSGVYIEDLRYEIGSIEVMGSNATEALRATLQPYWTLKRDRESDVDVYKDIDIALGPENHPGYPLFGFSIIDPRLRFPQKKIVNKLEPHRIQERNLAMIRWTKTAPETSYLLFNRGGRLNAVEHLPSQKSVNKRHGASRPGKFPELNSHDPPIPIILHIQRSPSRWVLMAPFRLVEPIWHCLTKCPLSTGGDVRFGGLQEQQQTTFEQCVGWFPADFPTTKAGQELEVEERERQTKSWERKSKSKRTEWKSVDLGRGRKGELGRGLACDWEFLFGLPRLEDMQIEREKNKEKEAAPTNIAPAVPMDGAGPDKDTDIPMGGVGEQKTTTSQVAPPPPSQPQDSRPSLKNVVRLSKAQWETLFLNFRRNIDTPVPDLALFSVKITFMGSGKASRNARIYRLPQKPAVEPPATKTQVPATATGSGGGSVTGSSLPADLREQWLSHTPAAKRAAEKAQDALLEEQQRQLLQQRKKQKQRNRHDHKKDILSKSSESTRTSTMLGPTPEQQQQSDLEARQRRVASSLFQPSQPLTPLVPPEPKDRETMSGGHPFVPGKEDLIGFITSGNFNLRLGKPSAVGHISARKVKEDLVKHGKLGEVATCIVRDAGEGVGWLARWEVI
ncbi:Ribonucleases P/MRP protein subunit pop1 [Zalerion maritima]|uniref:Ribonucleases P/MRP protein subunit pop1 n=1 Tax=Zalerion maritima TaxID=339359 RepID=A0AAD5RZ89_9PEZI|nr:Ribonucleases P/MRP protein subunit pop1 [Zalerion maritima]